MKTSTCFSLGLAGALVVLPLGALFAQDPSAAATPSVSTPPGTGAATSPGPGEGAGRGHHNRWLQALTPEERQEFKAARQKALSDPAVQAAKADRQGDKKAFHKVMHAAMLKADPNMEPIFQKIRESRMHRKDLQTS